MRFQRIIPIITLLTACGVAFADAKPADAPAAKAKPAADTQAVEVLQAQVVSIAGNASYRMPSDTKGKWTPVQAGEMLDELAIIRMGLGAKLVLQFSDRVKLTATGGGKFGLRTLRKQGDVVHANVGLKYGTLRLKVDSTVGPNDFSVTTPVATLSARGCNSILSYFPDTGLNFGNTQDTWVVSTNRGKKTTQQGDVTNQNLDSTGTIVSRQLNTQQSDPYGLGNVENTNLINNGGGRGVMDFGGTGAGGINTGGGVTPHCPSPPPSCPDSSPGGHYLDQGP